MSVSESLIVVASVACAKEYTRDNRRVSDRQAERCKILLCVYNALKSQANSEEASK